MHAYKTRFVALILAAVIALAQDQPVFEVASVRLSPERGVSNSPRFEPNGVNFQGVSLAAAIGEAYSFPYGRIIGPGSLTPERLWPALATGYDIVAKAAGPASKDQLRLRLQSLLAERFKLALHRQTKVGPMYALVATKGGPSFEESETGSVFGMSVSDGEYTFRGTEMRRFIGVLQGHLDRPVADATGLPGFYNFKLKVPQTLSDPQSELEQKIKSEVSGDWVSSTLIADLRKVGLDLRKENGPVEYLVIDHVEKVDAN